MFFYNVLKFNLLFKRILDIMFPKICGICKNKINKNNTCEKCSNILQYTLEKELCVRNLDFYVDRLFSLFQYSGIVRDRILDLKFNDKAYIANTFAEFMCDVIKKQKVELDIVIPVPIHIKRKWERGYNQSELISRFIAKELKIDHNNKDLIKYKNNLAQSTLNEENRKKNVKDVYRIRNNKRIIGKRILLVDDIYTTGATVNECAKVLKQNGAREVIVLTIAYARRKF